MYTINRFYFILILSIALASCQENKASEIIQEEEKTDSTIRVENKQFSESNFELGKVVQKSFPSTLNVTGSIHLPEKGQASVSSILNGTVGAVEWLEGQWVKKGAILFSITNPELINLQETYLVTESQLSYLKEEYNRQQKLAAENITTKKDLLKVKSELRTAEAKFNSVKKKLDLYGINTSKLNASNLVSSIAIKAPISGYISEINILRGSYLESTRMALKIANTSQAHLEVLVLEKDAAKLKKGQDIEFVALNSPNKKYKAKINIVNKIIKDNGMVTVQANLDEEATKDLMPGMFVKAEIVLNNHEHESLPKEALIKLDNDYYALQLLSKDNDGYDFNRIKVDVNDEYNGYISVNNISASAEYLTKGAYFLIQ